VYKTFEKQIPTPDKTHKRTVIEWVNYFGRYSSVCGSDRLLWWFCCYDFRLNQAQCAMWWFRASDSYCLLKKQAAAFHCCHSHPTPLRHYHFTPLAVSLLDTCTHVHVCIHTYMYALYMCVYLCIYTLYGACIRNSYTYNISVMPKNKHLHFNGTIAMITKWTCKALN
jgi:hypothetical protein